MIKKINESPTTSDTILFTLETPGISGLLRSDPVHIESVVIYYIERDFSKINDKSYEIKHFDISLERNVSNARKLANENPCPENIENLSLAKMKLEAAAVKHNLYFNNAKPVYTLGGKKAPAFVTADPMASVIKAVVKNKNGHEQFGHFQFEWSASGKREGDYFISWSWLTEEGVTLAAHQMFRLSSARNKNNYIPARYTQENKYETLLDRYTPEMYKTKITHTDLTPDVLGKFHLCIAKGFTQIEDMANSLRDIYDTNTTHQAILPLLASMFNLKLKSNNTTLWRRQIRQAVPLFKRKGTLEAIKEALDQAGIRLLKLTKLWQIVSEYNWTDGFVRANENATIGVLSRQPLDTNKIEVKIKASDSEEFLSVPKECISIVSNIDNDYKVLWIGELLDTPVNLYDGDVVLVQYQIKAIPPEKQSVEKYVQTLPLADHRDPTKQKFPLKNWNVRLIEEDDPLFEVIIQDRHPACDPVNFGKIRTTFLYSEKVYNMDTYNGSLRNSKIPCDIDKDFIDECSYCQSSKFNIDIEIEELSSERIDEAKEIIREYSPFHAILHSINVSGMINEFVISPIETIETLVNHANKDTVKTQSVKDDVGQQENISYEIEWTDGSKEKNQIGAI